MKERELQELVRFELLEHDIDDPDTLIITEMGIRNGKCRIDIAVLGDTITAIELKTDRDNLRRLNRQVFYYDQVATKSILVCAEKHLDKNWEVPTLPSWWGVYSISVKEDFAWLTRCRRPRINPTVNAEALACLLWKPEAVQVLDKFGAPKKFKRRLVAEIHEWIGKNVPLPDLTSVVLGKLKARTTWRRRQTPERGLRCCDQISKSMLAGYFPFEGSVGMFRRDYPEFSSEIKALADAILPAGSAMISGRRAVAQALTTFRDKLLSPTWSTES